ncbi:class I SAM-dependent methyltransferase [Massilia sp. UMI-21]|nr:class I SAM-dependent methyltransferase [Massilia sp. UMI-21]
MTREHEHERIARIYRQWSGGRALRRYERLRPEVLQQSADRTRALGAMLRKTVGPNLAALRVLDVGCGTGSFLRQLIDWGASPHKLTGTELLPERLELARLRTAQGVHWHLGGLDSLADGSVDLVTAHTVFSSILDEATRQALAGDMWRMLRPGGWCMVFDFRYNNPRNRNVRKLTRAELDRLWPARERHYRTLLLAPPLARALAGLPGLVHEGLAALLPPLRSHFVYMVRKDCQGLTD